MNTEIFTVNTSLTPQRKIRGKKRYYRRLTEDSEQFSIIEEPEHWFDLWHYHIDSSRLMSNFGWKHRKLHLDALFVIFHRLTEETKTLIIPFQLLILIHEQNGADDCIYLHTPNPQSDFPCILRNIKWGNKNIEQFFQEYLAPYDIRVGVSYDKEGKQKKYWLYSPSIGVPPE